MISDLPMVAWSCAFMVALRGATTGDGSAAARVGAAAGFGSGAAGVLRPGGLEGFHMSFKSFIELLGRTHAASHVAGQLPADVKNPSRVADRCRSFGRSP